MNKLLIARICNPTAVAMGGGYSKRIRDIVEAHCNTYRIAAHIFEEV